MYACEHVAFWMHEKQKKKYSKENKNKAAPFQRLFTCILYKGATTASHYLSKNSSCSAPEAAEQKWSEEQIAEEIRREAGNPVQTSPLTYRQLFKHCHRTGGLAGIEEMSFLDT